MDRFYVYLYSYDGTPFYVGKGKDKRYLPSRHFGNNRLLSNKMNKIGVDNIKITFLCEDITEQESILLEMFWINLIGRRDLNKGPLCNLTNGGDGISGYVKSEETKHKHSIALKGKEKTKESILKMVFTRKKNGSYSHTKESKENLSKKHKGRPSEKRGIKLSKEVCSKIQKATLGINNPMYGKNHTEEAKEKMRQAWLKRKQNG